MVDEQNGERTSHDALTSGSILLAILGCAVGLIAGFVLFVCSYQFLGPPTSNTWKVSILDGIVITAVGLAAYRFRKKSAFLQGIIVSAALLFIVNGLCGISGR